MNIKAKAIAALRARRNGRLRPGWSREELSRIGPLTARMLKARHIAELADREHLAHFGPDFHANWSMEFWERFVRNEEA